MTTELDADAPLAIEVEGVHKTFRIPTGQPDTLKERAVRPFKPTSYRRLEALRDISFGVRRGEFFGVVGRNGSGKSTLLKLLASIYRADRGRIRVAGTLSPVIELGVGFQPEMTAAQNILTNGLMLGFSKKEVQRRVDSVIEFAELGEFAELKLKNYSSGMRARLAFAIATQADPDVLLLDEVLAVGDPPFAKRCQETFDELKRTRRSTVVLVTHSMGNIERYCDRAMMLDKGSQVAIGDPREIGQRYTQVTTAEKDETLNRAPSRIEGIRLYDSEGKPTYMAEPGKHLRLRIVLDADEPLEAVRMRLWITNTLGTKIFAPQPFPLGSAAEPLGSGRRVRVAIKIENKLAPGRYTVHALLASGRGDDAAYSETVNHPFEVASNGKRDGGIVSLRYAIRTKAEQESKKKKKKLVSR